MPDSYFIHRYIQYKAPFEPALPFIMQLGSTFGSLTCC
jgi:hypothetical protein